MSDLKEVSIDFAVGIYNTVKDFNDVKPYVNQILRSSSSIGANLHEAKYAQSRADFINKMEVALKEAYETEYWLDVLYRIHKLSEDQYKRSVNICGSIRRKIIASIVTAKKNVE